MVKYKCPKCGYEYEGDELSEECLICKEHYSKFIISKAEETNKYSSSKIVIPLSLSNFICIIGLISGIVFVISFFVGIVSPSEAVVYTITISMSIVYRHVAADTTSTLPIAKGGKIELLDGTYNFQYDDDPIELTGNITIEGAGHTTVIHQPVYEDAGEAKPIFKITGENVILKNMMLCDSDISSPVEIISQQAQGAIYDGVFFILNASETSDVGGCIFGTNDCNYTRIQNCRVFKGFNNANVPMFDFSSCTNFGGVINRRIFRNF